jgi:hypothetical protein
MDRCDVDARENGALPSPRVDAHQAKEHSMF